MTHIHRSQGNLNTFQGDKTTHDVSTGDVVIHAGSWTAQATAQHQGSEDRDTLTSSSGESLLDPLVNVLKVDSPLTPLVHVNPGNQGDSPEKPVDDSAQQQHNKALQDSNCHKCAIESRKPFCTPLCRWYHQNAGKEPFDPLSRSAASHGTLDQHAVFDNQAEGTQGRRESTVSCYEGEIQDDQV